MAGTAGTAVAGGRRRRSQSATPPTPDVAQLSSALCVIANAPTRSGLADILTAERRHLSPRHGQLTGPRGGQQTLEPALGRDRIVDRDVGVDLLEIAERPIGPDQRLGCHFDRAANRARIRATTSAWVCTRPASASASPTAIASRRRPHSSAARSPTVTAASATDTGRVYPFGWAAPTSSGLSSRCPANHRRVRRPDRRPAGAVPAVDVRRELGPSQMGATSLTTRPDAMLWYGLAFDLGQDTGGVRAGGGWGWAAGGRPVGGPPKRGDSQVESNTSAGSQGNGPRAGTSPCAGDNSS
jgi:hypothetical protein